MELSDLEKESIEAFCANKTMYNAVKKVVLAGIYSHGVIKAGEAHDPYKNRAFALIASHSDSKELGDNVKAWFEGVGALEEAYNKLDQVRSEKEDNGEEEVNSI